MKYEVNIVYKGQVNYIVEADSQEKAEEIAEESWGLDLPGVSLGNEWESIENIESKEINSLQEDRYDK